MKSVITLSLVMMLLAFGAGNTNKDYTSFVQSSPPPIDKSIPR